MYISNPKVTLAFGHLTMKSLCIRTGDRSHLGALSAMVACPVGSIRTRTPDPLVVDAAEVFPLAVGISLILILDVFRPVLMVPNFHQVDGESLPGIYHLGFHAASSYGATSYFVEMADGARIMVDTPRFNERLAKAIDSRGGLDYIALTHIDDVGDHER